jgi:phage tail sheath protein FI
MAFQISPGVNTSEIDLTTTVGKGISTSVGGFAGKFQWGPANERILIGNEVELVDIFGKPTADTYEDFFSIANFLSYAGSAWVVRIGDANNSVNLNATSGTVGIRVDNDSEYDTAEPIDVNGAWIARYPGAKGNSLLVAACDSSVVFTSKIPVTGNTAGTWSQYFDVLPGTSAHASAKGGHLDEMHILVIDEDGDFSGTKGTVLEKYAHISKAPGAKSEDGTNNFYIDAINQRSKYIRSGSLSILNANTSGTLSSTWSAGGSDVISLSRGSDISGGNYTDEYTIAYDLFSNAEEVDVSLLISGAASLTIAQRVIDIAQNRKDAVAFISPTWLDVQPGQSGSDISTNVVDFKNLLARSSSYYVVDSGWKYQYDKYNDVYRWVPLNGDIAGLCARTDSTRDPWWSPAGFNRGNIQNIVKLAWNPTQAQRDAIYRVGVNPVVSFPGEGVILYGDKTGLSKPSAFDRINVRRLFIVLEKTISNASKYSLFEFNDEFTRGQFKSMVEPLLRDIKGRRGVYDFLVVCDETNNTPQVIDNNEFVGDIYIKPAKSVNFIQLNFVAVRSGVEFNEVVGNF